jgi:hypothetical protein
MLCPAELLDAQLSSQVINLQLQFPSLVALFVLLKYHNGPLIVLSRACKGCAHLSVHSNARVYIVVV